MIDIKRTIQKHLPWFIKHGTTRIVFLIGPYAVKVPNVFRWKCLLRGLLGNMDERLWFKNSPAGWKSKMAPSYLCLFGGFVLIAGRAEPIDLEDYQELDIQSFQPLPMDKKLMNFGRYDGRIVLVDYADSRHFCSGCEQIFKCKKVVDLF